MGLLEDVDKRLAGADDRLTDLVERLEGMRPIEEEYAESGRKVGELAVRAREAAESLGSAAESVREASDVVRQSDPARMLAAVAGLERRLEELPDRLASEMRGIKEQQASEAAARAESVLEELRNQAGGLKSRLADDSGRVDKRLDALEHQVIKCPCCRGWWRVLQDRLRSFRSGSRAR